ncbi:MAG: hypothetical protein FJ296_01485 [Planctomycetes bacterium]|nr:hypothetical protein [Planctomycetota bacterium]
MPRWAVVLVLLAAVLPFAESRHWPAVHDDHDLLGPGSLVADPRAGAGLLLRADLFGSVERPWGESGYWRPVTLLAYRAAYWLADGQPLPAAWLGHMATLLMHALATWGVARLLVALGWRLEWAAGVAVLFGVHPVHAEAAAWISGLATTGASAAGLWGAAVLVASRRPRAELLAGALLLLALGFKESGVVPLGIAAALALALRRPWPVALRAPAVALLAYVLLRKLLFHEGVSAAAWTGPADLATRWWTWLGVVPDVVRLSAWPDAATPLRPVEPAAGWGSPGVAAGLLVLALLVGLAAGAAFRRSAVGLLAALALLGTLLLLAPLKRLALGFPETSVALFERHLHLAALVGPLLLGLLARPWAERAPRVALGLALALAVPVGLHASARARTWSSDEAFARAGLAYAPEAASLWNHLGVALLQRQREERDDALTREALQAIERSLALRPGDLLASVNRFIALAMLGRAEDATRAARQLLERHPHDPGVLDNVAQWHLAEGRFDEAAALFARELETGRPLPGAEAGLEAAMAGMDAVRTGRERPGNAPSPPGAAGAEGGT